MTTLFGSAFGFSAMIALTAVLLGLRVSAVLIRAARLWATLPWDTLSRPRVRMGLSILGLFCLPLIVTACGGSGKSGY